MASKGDQNAIEAPPPYDAVEPTASQATSHESAVPLLPEGSAGNKKKQPKTRYSANINWRTLALTTLLVLVVDVVLLTFYHFLIFKAIDQKDKTLHNLVDNYQNQQQRFSDQQQLTREKENIMYASYFEMKNEIKQIKENMTSMTSQLRGEIMSVNTSLETRFSHVAANLKDQLSELNSSVENRFVNMTAELSGLKDSLAEQNLPASKAGSYSWSFWMPLMILLMVAFNTFQVVQPRKEEHLSMI